MQFTSTQAEMLRCLNMVEKAVATRDTQEILTGIYLECGDGKLTLRATDSEISMEAYTTVETLTPGSMVLKSKYFVPLIRRLPPGEVTFKQLKEQQMLEITAGSGSFRLQTMVGTDFPSLPTGNGLPLLEMPCHLLAKMIRQTAYATREDQGHSVFAGVLMEYKADELRLVATDTNRLCFNRQTLPGRTSISLYRPVLVLSYSVSCRQILNQW